MDYCTQVGLPEPTFEGKWGGLAVIFTKQKGAKPWETTDGSTKEVAEKTVEKSSPKSSPKIIRLIGVNPNITTLEIAKILGLSKRAVLKNIKKLKEQNKLKRVGPNKGGYWEVIDTG